MRPTFALQKLQRWHYPNQVSGLRQNLSQHLLSYTSQSPKAAPQDCETSLSALFSKVKHFFCGVRTQGIGGINATVEDCFVELAFNPTGVPYTSVDSVPNSITAALRGSQVEIDLAQTASNHPTIQRYHTFHGRVISVASDIDVSQRLSTRPFMFILFLYLYHTFGELN